MSTAAATKNPFPSPVKAALAERQAAPLCFSAARVLLVAVLIAAPLAFGAVQTWAWVTLDIVAVVLLLLWAIGSIQQGVVQVHWSPLYIPAMLFLLLGIVQFAGHLTLDPVGTRESLIKIGTDTLFLFIAGQLAVSASEKTWEIAAFLVTVYTFALSIFAVLQYFSSHGLIYWTVKVPLATVFGPYVNHNHYAGLMEMLIPLSAGYFLCLPSDKPWRPLIGVAVVVSLVSVLLSGSRGGFISLLAETLILAIFLRLRLWSQVGRRLTLTIALGIIAAALLFFWADRGKISKHLATIANLPKAPDRVLGGRVPVWLDSLQMTRKNLWRGVGLGSFEVVYPQYQSFPTDVRWDHAHNDYLEAAAETGLPGFALILIGLVMFVNLAFPGAEDRIRTTSGRLQFAAALGCCGILVHSFSDFNLHIPANAMWFAVLLAVATHFGRTFPTEKRGDGSTYAPIPEKHLLGATNVGTMS